MKGSGKPPCDQRSAQQLLQMYTCHLIQWNDPLPSKSPGGTTHTKLHESETKLHEAEIKGPIHPSSLFVFLQLPCREWTNGVSVQTACHTVSRPSREVVSKVESRLLSRSGSMNSAFKVMLQLCEFTEFTSGHPRSCCVVSHGTIPNSTVSITSFEEEGCQG